MARPQPGRGLRRLTDSAASSPVPQSLHENDILDRAITEIQRYLANLERLRASTGPLETRYAPATRRASRRLSTVPSDPKQVEISKLAEDSWEMTRQLNSAFDAKMRQLGIEDTFATAAMTPSIAPAPLEDQPAISSTHSEAKVDEEQIHHQDTVLLCAHSLGLEGPRSSTSAAALAAGPTTCLSPNTAVSSTVDPVSGGEEAGVGAKRRASNGSISQKSRQTRRMTQQTRGEDSPLDQVLQEVESDPPAMPSIGASPHSPSPHENSSPAPRKGQSPSHSSDNLPELDNDQGSTSSEDTPVELELSELPRLLSDLHPNHPSASFAEDGSKVHSKFLPSTSVDFLPDVPPNYHPDDYPDLLPNYHVDDFVPGAALQESQPKRPIAVKASSQQSHESRSAPDDVSDIDSATLIDVQVTPNEKQPAKVTTIEKIQESLSHIFRINHEHDGNVLVLYPTMEQWQDFPGILAFARSRGATKVGAFKVRLSEETVRELGPCNTKEVLPRPKKPCHGFRSRRLPNMTFNVTTTNDQRVFRRSDPSPLPLEDVIRHQEYLLRKKQGLKGVFYRTDMPVQSATDRFEAGLPPQSAIWPLSGDMLRKTKQEIPGIHWPYGYESGSEFGAPFALHNEDFDLHSVSHLYRGRKIWIGIPPAQAGALERKMRETDKSIGHCGQCIRHRSLFVPTTVLREWGVTYTLIDQRAGDIVITLPRTYHMGFSTGHTLAEASNYADSEWTPNEYPSCPDSCPDYPIDGSLMAFLAPGEVQKKYEPDVEEDGDTDREDDGAAHVSTGEPPAKPGQGSGLAKEHANGLGAASANPTIASPDSPILTSAMKATPTARKSSKAVAWASGVVSPNPKASPALPAAKEGLKARKNLSLALKAASSNASAMPCGSKAVPSFPGVIPPVPAVPSLSKPATMVPKPFSLVPPIDAATALAVLGSKFGSAAPKTSRPNSDPLIANKPSLQSSRPVNQSSLEIATLSSGTKKRQMKESVTASAAKRPKQNHLPARRIVNAPDLSGLATLAASRPKAVPRPSPYDFDVDEFDEMASKPRQAESLHSLRDAIFGPARKPARPPKRNAEPSPYDFIVEEFDELANKPPAAKPVYHSLHRD